MVSGLASAAAEDSLASALALADRLGNPDLIAAAQQAYLHAMTHVLYTSTAPAALAAVLIAVLLPGRPAQDSTPAQKATV